MLEILGAGEGNRTLVISLEGLKYLNAVNKAVDIFVVRTRLDAIEEIGFVHPLEVDRGLARDSASLRDYTAKK